MKEVFFMSRENMNKFFSECKNNLNLQNELLSLKKESENLNGLNIINFLNKISTSIL